MHDGVGELCACHLTKHITSAGRMEQGDATEETLSLMSPCSKELVIVLTPAPVSHSSFRSPVREVRFRT